MLVLMCLSCNLHDGIERQIDLAGLSWSCQDLLILPDIFVLIPGSTIMFLVRGMIGIQGIPLICRAFLCPILGIPMGLSWK